MSLSPFRRKLKDLRYLYGQPAATYFEAQPLCEYCGEDRLAALAIHHTEGKAVTAFRTLCHNCHAVEHNGATTYLLETQRLAVVAGIKQARVEKYARCKALAATGLSLRQIARLVGTSHVTVWNALAA